MLPRKAAAAAVSLARPRRGLAKARTGYPSCWRRSISPLQLAVSAHAPCTSTTVGLTAQALGAATAAEPPPKMPPPKTTTAISTARAPRVIFMVRGLPLGGGLNLLGLLMPARRRIRVRGNADRRQVARRRHAVVAAPASAHGSPLCQAPA